MDMREQILAARDFEAERVDVPEWGVTVWIRRWSSAALEGFYADLAAARESASAADAAALREAFSPVRYQAMVLVRSIANEDGSPVFRMDDFDALGTRNPDVLKRLFEIADRVNGISGEALEDIEGN